MPEQNVEKAGCLDPAQKEAIIHVSGPMLLIAGPGSGKTRVITERIKNLIENHRVLPESILVITFTKKAALQMQARSIAICKRASQVAFGTFHSVFYHILRQSKQYQHVIPLTQTEKNNILAEICDYYLGNSTLSKEMKLNHHTFLKEVTDILAYCKNTGTNFDEIMNMDGNEILKQMEVESADQKQRKLYTDVMYAYQRECQLAGKIDFDDMLYLCKKLLLSDQEQLNKWQNRYRYIMIDEFQDINQIQYDVISMLCQTGRNLFVVGDDDQAIYGFRGSSPAFMQLMERDFYPCRRLALSVNYRSCKAVVNASNTLICHNVHRYEKKIRTNHEEEGQVGIIAFESQMQEIAWIRELIQKTTFSSLAVLCRTNRELCIYEKGLGKEEKKAEFDRQTVTDILAMLHMAIGDRDRKYYYCFMNKPDRGISRIAVDDPVSFHNLKQKYVFDEQKKNMLEKLERDLARMGSMDPLAAILYGCNVLHYMQYLKSLEENRQAMASKTIEKIKELAANYSEIRELIQVLEQQQEALTFRLKDDFGKQRKDSENLSKVQLMTYHASKGLEFDTVILPGVNKGCVPHGKMLSEMQLEEERRMFYVAMTRAKKNLYISYQEDVQEKGQISEFILQLQDGLSDENRL